MGCEIYKQISAVACRLLGLPAGGSRLSGHTTAPEAPPFQPGAGVHEARAQLESSFQPSNRSELSSEPEPVSPPPTTRTSFMATWKRTSGVKGYLLDVSTNSSFTTYLD